jgi:hypothetical protein
MVSPELEAENAVGVWIVPASVFFSGFLNYSFLLSIFLHHTQNQSEHFGIPRILQERPLVLELDQRKPLLR